ncbi:hypothetical protein ACJQWK_11138 [Exserohilum turcicum]
MFSCACTPIHLLNMFLSTLFVVPFASVTLAARIPQAGSALARAELDTVMDVTAPSFTWPHASTMISTSSVSSAWPAKSDPAVPDEKYAGVYICEDIAWGGHCEHKLTKPGGADIDCTQLSGNASSIGPDPGFLCEFYT